MVWSESVCRQASGPVAMDVIVPSHMHTVARRRRDAWLESSLHLTRLKVKRARSPSISRRGLLIAGMKCVRSISMHCPKSLFQRALTVQLSALDPLGAHSKRFVDFVDNRQLWLDGLPVAFFSVSLSASGTDKEREEANDYVNHLLDETGWKPQSTATIGGGLMYRKWLPEAIHDEKDLPENGT